MAAAIIPLIASIAPTIIDLITSLVHKKAPQTEQQLGSGTGPVKFADVFTYVMNALTQAAQAGTIDKQLPTDDTIKLVIQSVVTSMNKLGLLDSPPSTVVQQPATQPTTFKILGGTIQVGA